MNWFDIVLLVLLALSVFGGAKAGLITSVLSLAGLIVGIILAGRYYPRLAETLSFISNDTIAAVVAFAIILIGIMVLAAALGALLKWIIKSVMLEWVDRIGGAAFGLVLGAIFYSSLIAMFVKFFGMPDFIKESTIADVMLGKFPGVLALLPGDFDAIRNFFK